MRSARFLWIVLPLLCFASALYGDEIYVDDVYIYEDDAESGKPAESRPKIPTRSSAGAPSNSAKAGFRKPDTGWRDTLYSRILSGGVEVAHRTRYAYTDPGGESMHWASGDLGDITWFFGFNARMFLGKNWGVGLEGLIMNVATAQGSSGYQYTSYGGYHYYLGIPGCQTTIIKWLCDLDILYRYALTPRFLANAGAGLTMDARTWDTTEIRSGEKVDSGVEIGNMGYNFKLGVEYFIDEKYSITADWKRQHWGTGVGSEKYSISSVVVGVSMSF
ncbi:MAG: porin family protein [Spirochaetota bacterium]|jgi:hypothetical protein|nr:porin family protein [Spirochaetota bacterium]